MTGLANTEGGAQVNFASVSFEMTPDYTMAPTVIQVLSTWVKE
jgi:hypothetical protein